MSNRIAIAIHGGAENKIKKQHKEREQEYRDVLAESIAKGYEKLERGKHALDAVEAAIIVMEDSPLYNAGRGSSFNEDGTHCLDVGLMEGEKMKTGSAAAFSHIKNPIKLARLIMDEAKNNFLSGKGVEDFAREHKLDIEPMPYFSTKDKFREFIKANKGPVSTLAHDTIGAVALDKKGNLAAGTSTGGLTNQMRGRVSDSACIGAGVFAHNSTCAISVTGDGDEILRGVLAHDIYAQMRYAGKTPQEAWDYYQKEYKSKTGGTKGLVLVDTTGNVHMFTDCKIMFRACRTSDGDGFVALWKDEEYVVTNGQIKAN